jgi:DNA processing protein
MQASGPTSEPYGPTRTGGTQEDTATLQQLGLWAAPGVGPVTLAAVLQLARAEGLCPAAAAALPHHRLRAAGCPRAGRRALAQAPPTEPAGRRVLQALARMGARALLQGRDGYPDRLTRALDRRASPVLVAAGDASLLRRRPCVALVGSREPSQSAAAACRRLSRDLASAGQVVVSGGARGIDTLAHSAALPQGPTVVVSPVGLGRFRWRGRRPGPEDSWCLLSQFPPDTRWRDEQALMRNCTIVALADAVVAFEPRDRGGTWHSCNQAIRLGRPLFVVNAREDAACARGQRSLVRRGAVALAAGHMPSPEELQEMATRCAPAESGVQGRLFER